MATFFNQATLSYGDTVLNSNVTEGELASGINMTKTALSSSYSREGGVIYLVTITNSQGNALVGATLSDNLGAYAPTAGAPLVYPLAYREGSIRYFVGGEEMAAPEAVAGPPLSITGIDLPAGETGYLIYEAAPTGAAPLAAGSTVTNTATLSGAGIIEPLSDTATVGVLEGFNLAIAKALCPTTVGESGELTYTFVIQNTGNLAVVATDGVVLSDTFNPILNPISVTLDGAPLDEGSYSYDNTTGVFTVADGVITVPAATYTEDAASGNIVVTPGVTVLTVTGTV